MFLLRPKSRRHYSSSSNNGVYGLESDVDSVDRGVLYEAMREKGIRKGLIERVKEVLSETRSMVRVGGMTERSFWRGVRQGCLLSSVLFNIVIADLEEEMGRIKWGGIRIGERKIYMLAKIYTWTISCYFRRMRRG